MRVTRPNIKFAIVFRCHHIRKLRITRFRGITASRAHRSLSGRLSNLKLLKSITIVRIDAIWFFFRFKVLHIHRLLGLPCRSFDGRVGNHGSLITWTLISITIVAYLGCHWFRLLLWRFSLIASPLRLHHLYCLLEFFGLHEGLLFFGHNYLYLFLYSSKFWLFLV